MKLTGRCPKCHHNHLLYVAEVADLGENGTVWPMYVARTATKGSFLGLSTGKVVAAGVLEAAVCRRCGYTEFYVKDPGSIPIDGTAVRELIGPE